MKSKLITLLAVLAALLLCCSVASATEDEFHSLLARIVDPENPVVYTFATTELGFLSPVEGYDPSWMVTVLQLASLTPVRTAEVPDGEYVVLYFPEENIRYDFFLTDKEKNYARQVNPDGTEELFRVTMPDDVFVTVSDVLSLEVEELAEASGLIPQLNDYLPESGWVADSLGGTDWWADDRVCLRITVDTRYRYHVTVTWGGSAWERKIWYFLCEYNTDEDSLRAFYCACDIEKYDENGEMEHIPLYEGESAASFFLNDQGQIAVSFPADGLLDEKVFSRSLESESNR